MNFLELGPEQNHSLSPWHQWHQHSFLSIVLLTSADILQDHLHFIHLNLSSLRLYNLFCHRSALCWHKRQQALHLQIRQCCKNSTSSMHQPPLDLKTNISWRNKVAERDGSSSTKLLSRIYVRARLSGLMLHNCCLSLKTWRRPTHYLYTSLAPFTLCPIISWTKNYVHTRCSNGNSPKMPSKPIFFFSRYSLLNLTLCHLVPCYQISSSGNWDSQSPRRVEQTAGGSESTAISSSQLEVRSPLPGCSGCHQH